MCINMKVCANILSIGPLYDLGDTLEFLQICQHSCYVFPKFQIPR
ncbi:hypothetical protein PHET_11697 [Paragonimus heterotremus]|uniref:Uncharacterized protein n=1 Tax=Paragonimus heterotremus TaxID=100268 RepID=A0A8J4SYH3_9TREM|nr:hypothetical protein PHET_11697 [Paragonimus heterotremus]